MIQFDAHGESDLTQVGSAGLIIRLITTSDSSRHLANSIGRLWRDAGVNRGHHVSKLENRGTRSFDVSIRSGRIIHTALQKLLRQLCCRIVHSQRKKYSET
jgi:hypothetical protein